MLCPGEYSTMIRSKDHPFDLRKTLVRHAKSHGIRSAMRSFATECASVYAEIAIRRLLKHLRDCGADLSLTVVNSDNGPGLKGNQIRDDGSHFADAVRALGAAHRFNPPSCPNANADVESSHSRIEAEFYDREDFSDLDKAHLYQTYWNLGRPNRSKNNQSPCDILHAIRPSLSLDVFLLKPAFLDTLLPAFLHPNRVGHNVPPTTAVEAAKQ